MWIPKNETRYTEIRCFGLEFFDGKLVVRAALNITASKTEANNFTIALFPTFEEWKVACDKCTNL